MTGYIEVSVRGAATAATLVQSQEDEERGKREKRMIKME